MTVENIHPIHQERMAENKKKILFVCLGNICRSAAAEAVMKSIVHKHDADSDYVIDSAGILSYHQGDPADPRMRFFAGQRGYDVTSISRPVVAEDFNRFDWIIGMDDSNIDDLKEKAYTVEHLDKIHKMTEFTRHSDMDHVPDPYYGGSAGFERVMDLLEDACEGLFYYLEKKK